MTQRNASPITFFSYVCFLFLSNLSFLLFRDILVYLNNIQLYAGIRYFVLFLISVIWSAFTLRLAFALLWGEITIGFQKGR